jgi:hypothetical protein
LVLPTICFPIGYPTFLEKPVLPILGLNVFEFEGLKILPLRLILRSIKLFSSFACRSCGGGCGGCECRRCGAEQFSYSEFY